MSTPKKERPVINRSYDIFVDQNDWLVNSSLNKSKKIRELLDNFINEVDATVIQNLKDEIHQYIKEINELNRTIENNLDKYTEAIQKLKEKIESQKAVIVALGGEE